MIVKKISQLHRLKFFILVIILSIPTFIKLARPGYFPMHDDMQAMRVYQMDKCIQDGQIPCRWVPDMGYGYGYPQFIYYSPLPYYAMELFHLIGFSFIDSVKIIMALGFSLAGVTMFIFTRSLWGNWGGILSSVLYLYAPYRASDLYSRGAVAEFFGMIFLPLILYAIHQFIKTEKNSALITLSLSYAALLLSHNLTTLAFTPLAIIFGLVLLYQYKKFNLLPKLIFSSLLGVGLSAFFILPVIFEKPYAHIETMTIGYFNYLAHFVSLNQLFFSSFWGFGSSELGPYDDLSFTIGIFHWLFLLITAFLSLLYFNKERRKSILVLFLTFFFVAAVFMTHQKSSPIWNTLTFLKYFQFPWRFLVIATFTSSAAGGALIFFTKNKQAKITLTLVLSFLVILINFNFLRPDYWIDITDQQKFSGQSWDKQMTISIFDYLPIFAPTPPSAPAPIKPTILEGKALITDFTKGSDWQTGNIVVSTSEAVIKLPLFYFPGFSLLVDNKKTTIDYTDQGLITFKIPQGQHRFSVNLTGTLTRNIADLLSLVSASVIIIWLIHEKYQTN